VPAARPGPLVAATRPHLELSLRWLQEVRRFKPSTVSRRMSVVTGFYRTCVIDGVHEHFPAEYVRRPRVPAEPPTLGLSHLQFEAMLAAAKASSNECDLHWSRYWDSSGCGSSRPPVATSAISARSTATASSALLRDGGVSTSRSWSAANANPTTYDTGAIAVVREHGVRRMSASPAIRAVWTLGLWVRRLSAALPWDDAA
jgi:hypothetical protein